ncbi:MAG: hypothetical protein HQL31_04445 [Planctomycetes bacterium]|nr:hypothetical protein [Planctomycetota bacterium]
MLDLNDRELFAPVTHPESGVVIRVLKRKVAPVQEAFYFVNDSMSADGRYLWFYCAFPPSSSSTRGRTLGVLDFQTGEIRHFPETQFGEASPYVDVKTGEVYWQCDRYLWKRGPEADAPVERVNAVPEELIGGRQVLRTATHLTRSADGKEFFIDLGLEMQWLFGSLPIDGGDFKLWHRFDRFYNHAAFSPTDPDEVLFAQEFHDDPITGLTFPITERLWLLRCGEDPRPILREQQVKRAGEQAVSHEWWDADGKYVWCVLKNETWRVRVADGEVEKIVFPLHCWHSHCARDGRLIVSDSVVPKWPFHRGGESLVHFLNRDTGKTLILAENPERADYAGRNYHIDPHPRFVCGDRYIVFTTTVRGEIDLAIAATAELRGMTT